MVFIRRVNNGLLRRGVLEFDVTSIPLSARISSVSLELSVIDTPNSLQDGGVSLYMALTERGEGTSSGNGQSGPSQTDDATWIHTFYDSSQWNTAGGDFIATASAVSNFNNQASVISFNSTAELIADVSTWVQDSQNNHGWVC